MVVSLVVYGGLVVLSGVGVLWGLGSLLVGFDRYREANAVRTTPIATLDAVAVGPTAVRGRVEPVDRPFTTLHGTDEAVAYDLTVEDVGSSDTETLVDDRNAVAFDIVTEEGSVRVREAAFDMLVSEERRWTRERGSHDAPDDGLREFEREWGIGTLPAGYDRTYELSYLRPGDEVYAYGTVEIDAERPQEAKPVVLTDRDGLFFLSDRGPEALVEDRRRALAREALKGIPVATVSLAAFLWLTGIAQALLGA